MELLHSIFDYNRRLSRRCTPSHVQETNVFGAYSKIGALLMSRPDVKRVLDCGAGPNWHFPEHYKRWYGLTLVGLDIDGNEMVGNRALDEAIECDVTKAIPVEPESFDLMTVYSGIEHFSDNEAFLRHAYSALRPGGFMLAQFPSRYAPFAIANRVLPGWAAARLLHFSMREDEERLGFKAHYDRTNYKAFRAMAEVVGFEAAYYAPGYYSSTYAEFFFPLWLASYAYDVVRFGLGVRDLASYNLFVLRKPGGDAERLTLYA